MKRSRRVHNPRYPKLCSAPKTKKVVTVWKVGGNIAQMLLFFHKIETTVNQPHSQTQIQKGFFYLKHGQSLLEDSVDYKRLYSFSRVYQTVPVHATGLVSNSSAKVYQITATRTKSEWDQCRFTLFTSRV